MVLAELVPHMDHHGSVNGGHRLVQPAFLEKLLVVVKVYRVERFRWINGEEPAPFPGHHEGRLGGADLLQDAGYHARAVVAPVLAVEVDQQVSGNELFLI